MTLKISVNFPVTISVSHQVSTNAVVSLNTMDAHFPGDGEYKSIIASSLWTFPQTEL